MPIFWIALVAFYLLFFKLGWLPGGGRLDPDPDAPTHLTGMYTVDARCTGSGRCSWSALRHEQYVNEPVEAGRWPGETRADQGGRADVDW